MRSILNSGKQVFCTNTASALVCNAFEKFLMNESSRRATPFLFVRKSNPIVFVGCNQNPRIELDLDRLQRNKVEIGRLTSGGGSTYLDENTLIVSFIKSESNRKDIHNEKTLDFSLNNNIVMNCLKNFVNKSDVISQKHMDFFIKNDKVVHGTMKHNGIHRTSFKFGCELEKTYFTRKQNNTMNLESLRKFTPFSSNDFEAYIVSKFQQFYPPNYSSRMYIEDIDMRKGAVHGMSNALKQRSMNDNPDRIERNSGITMITEQDMLCIPEVKAMYNIKKSDTWIYQKHPHLLNYSEKQIVRLSNTFDWGSLDIRLYCDMDRKIENIECFSDSNNKNIVDILKSIFLNVSLKDQSQLMESFQTHLCHEIIEDTGSIFVINDVHNWLNNTKTSLDQYINNK